MTTNTDWEPFEEFEESPEETLYYDHEDDEE